MYQTLSFFAASCILFITFVEDVSNDVELLNVGGESNRSHKKIQLSKIVRQHADLKQLSKVVVLEFWSMSFLEKICSFVVDWLVILMKFVNLSRLRTFYTLSRQYACAFWYFFRKWYVKFLIKHRTSKWIELHFLSYNFPSQSGDSNPVEVMSTVVQMLYIFATLFIYCEFGERVAHEFNIFHEKLCNCNWYLFSIEVKRIFLITISGTERPTPIQGFANCTCTRDTFKAVI